MQPGWASSVERGKGREGAASQGLWGLQHVWTVVVRWCYALASSPVCCCEWFRWWSPALSPVLLLVLVVVVCEWWLVVVR